jgi:predicted DNA-binding transcriptional regulator YafY
MLVRPTARSLPISREDINTFDILMRSSPLFKLPEMQKRCSVLLMKIGSLIKDEAQVDLQREIIIDTEPSPKFHFDMNQLEEALLSRNQCRILYQSLEDTEPHWRLIDPYALVIRGFWYLIAYNPAKQSVNLYRLERISKFEVLPETFKKPKDFSVETYFEDSWNVFRGKKYKVRIRLKGVAARFALERQWPESRAFHWETENQGIIEVTVQGHEEIISWILSLGNNAELLSPKSLRDKIKQQVLEIVEAYKT